MDERQKQLTNLNTYIEEIDKDLTNIVQTLLWDRRCLMERKDLVVCKHDSNHRFPLTKMEEHEKKCFLKTNGYVDDDILLPDPPDSNYCMTQIKLGKEELALIINTASNADPTFKKGKGPQGSEPMTLERLQCTYTSDERRAIHDAVVAAAPSCHDLSDLALLSTNSEQQKYPKAKSRLEVLAELRNMKRRRTKYRVAAKTRNYSDVLRDVIKTQMETYKETQDDIASDTIILDNKTTKFNPTESNSDNFAEMSHKKIEESHKDNKHRSRSKERFREDNRSSYKYTERHRDEDRPRNKFRETGNNVPKNRYKYGEGYNDRNIIYNNRSKEEFRKKSCDERKYKKDKHRSKSKYASEDEIKIESHKSIDDKQYECESRVKCKRRSEEKRFEGYPKERNRYSDCDRKDEKVRHRRYYDAFDKKGFNNERWKRRK